MQAFIVLRHTRPQRLRQKIHELLFAKLIIERECHRVRIVAMGNGGLRVCLQNLYADAQRLRGNISRARKMARAVGIAGAHESIRDRVTGPARGLKRHGAYAARRAGLVNCGTVGT